MKEISTILVVLTVLNISLSAQGQPWFGSGIEGDPYLIEDANDMQAIGAEPDYWDAHFEMVNDINLAEFTGTEFNIIGTSSYNSFAGVFDGNNHTIFNFSYDSSESYLALFGYVKDGQIRDLALIDCNVVNFGTGVAPTGSLVGYLNNGTVSGCYVAGSVSGDDWVGGLVGADIWSEISDSSSNCEVSGNNGIGNRSQLLTA